MPETLLEHIIDIKSTLRGQDVKLDSLERAVLGGDQPGLVQRVESLEGSRNKLWGAGGIIAFLLSIAEALHLTKGNH